MILDMVNQHRYTNRNYRPDDSEYEPAKTLIEAAGFSMNVLVRAFLRLLRDEPDRTLRILRPHLEAIEAEKPRGRPGPRTSKD